MKLTTSEIAKMAGVHRSTVDRVMHGRPGVSEQTRKRILQVIEACDYKPNILKKARLRNRGEVHIEAVLLAVDAYDSFLRGIHQALSEFDGFHCSLQLNQTPHLDVAAQQRAIEKARASRPDAIILQPLNAPGIEAAVRSAISDGIPVLTINSDIEHSCRTAFIGEDMFRSGRTAARLMAEFMGGAGEVAILTCNNDLFSVRDREYGFRDRMRDFPNIRLLPAIETMEQPDRTFKLVVDLLVDHPRLDGLFMTCGCVAQMGKAVLDLDRQGTLKIMTYELYPETERLIRESVITCSIESGLQNQAYRAVKTVIGYRFFGHPLPANRVYTRFNICLRENLSGWTERSD